jgi:SEC-C motif domain protein
MKDCPCGSNSPLTDCCAPLIWGSGFPDTAEDLMRSRYTAFTQKNWEYLVITSHPEEKKEMAKRGPNLIEDGVVWKRLEITNTRAGGYDDSDGQIDFIAHYTKDGLEQTIRESSRFYKVNGRWVYSRKDSILSPVPTSPHTKHTKPKTIVRSEAKIGRNDPCPCGSGNKYKKCCG